MICSRRLSLFLLFLSALGIPAAPFLAAGMFGEPTIQERKPYGKPIRTRMPPQVVIDAIQKDFDARSPQWDTFWNLFVVEDDQAKGEYVIVARSMEKKWALGVMKSDCPKPDDFDILKQQAADGSSPVRIDVLIGVKKKRSFFRYVIQLYQPMYRFWDNPCYVWNLPPGSAATDKFYNRNYTMEVYSKNLAQRVHTLVNHYSRWKAPKEVTSIPVMKGPGQELFGGDADTLLSDEEKALPLFEQERILKKKRAEQTKAQKKAAKKAQKEAEKRDKQEQERE